MYVAENKLNSIMEGEKNKSNKKISYSLKKLIKQIFRQHKSEKLIISQNIANTNKANSLESLESLENSKNAEIESECTSLESYENDANERLCASAAMSCEMEDYDLADLITVPVHFVRTDCGTFFWTAASSVPADNDLIEPLYCCTSNQVATSQIADRWAQA